MNKLGINTYTISNTDYINPYMFDEGSGIWDKEKKQPCPIVFGRYKEVGVKYLRYGSGLNNRYMNFVATMTHGFTIDDFIICCKLIDAVPIICPSVFQPVVETQAILKRIRFSYEGPLCVEIGNESFMGLWHDGSWNWPMNYEPEQYVIDCNKLIPVIKDAGGTVGIQLLYNNYGPSHPHLVRWNTVVAPALKDVADFTILHFYDWDVSKIIAKCDEFHDMIAVPIFVTEYNHKDIKKKYEWLIATFRALEEYPAVLAHCLWDGACNDPTASNNWRTFNADKSKTETWFAVENYYMKG